MVFNLTNKTALITGAGSGTGIGFASAKFLNSMGAKVFITGKSDRIIDRAKELNCPYFVADLTKEAEVLKLIKLVDQEFGQLDVLTNNAGMTSVIDKSGWYLLIPLFNFYLAATHGDSGNNRFGAKPETFGSKNWK